MENTLVSLRSFSDIFLKKYCNSKNFYRFLVAYGVYKAIYLAFFDPLRKVPGPWWSRFTVIPYAISRINGENARYSEKLHNEYGPVVRVAPTQVSISNLKDIKNVLASYRYPKSAEYDAIILKEPNVLTTTDEPRNRMRRRQIGPAFTFTGLETVEELILDTGTRSFKKKLIEIIENGDGVGEFNSFNFFQSIASDVIGLLTFGKSFGAVQNDGHSVATNVNGALQFSTIIRAYPALKPFGLLFPKLLSERNALRQMCLEAIKQRKNDIENGVYDSSRIDILQMLITSINSTNKKNLTNDELVPEMVIMMVAGIDTTSVTMTWLLFIYMVYPDVYAKVKDEIRTTFPDRSQTIKYQEVRSKCPYFMATLYECMRIKAAVNGVMFRRNATDGIELSGYTIPKGVDMGVYTDGAHFDTTVWEKPESFMPERFMGPDGDTLKKNVVAFSYGVRICLGRNLAWMEMLTVIPNLLRDFECKLPADSKYGPHVLDPTRNNEPLLLEDKTFATRVPQNIKDDCRIIVTLRAD
ncbi:hypothetical protein BB558_000405 [Smittium angustum]|uniref:Cytochrome P450 n=1 Tax=Smittium angustum TaxID=133377 RepID=A0A2U1JEP7_SMIAN|nr:hypothetical protein BB558_000405 [Smittium angustum]